MKTAREIVGLDSLERLEKEGYAVVPDEFAAYCRAAQDGDCIWDGCPQERDGEPRKTGRHCPLDRVTRER